MVNSVEGNCEIYFLQLDVLLYSYGIRSFYSVLMLFASGGSVLS